MVKPGPGSYPEYRKAREYESPFQVPGIHCNNPAEARQLPYAHASSNCPYHKGRRERSNMTGPVVSDAWREWEKWREEYAKAVNEYSAKYAMEKMLSYVSETCPPDAPLKPQKTTKTRVKTWYDIDGRPHTYEKPKRTSNEVALLLYALGATLTLVFCILAILI